MGGGASFTEMIASHTSRLRDGLRWHEPHAVAVVG
jgi:hypothetical protein